MSAGELQQFVVTSVRTTGRILGEGSYGCVEEAEIPGAACVIKKLHEALLPHPDEAEGAVAMSAGFMAECRLMTMLRHPHVVQFLGICSLPESRLPALIMEKLATDLHNFLLENANVPLSIKHSILVNVSQGLTYLHGRDPPIIHRDLTARNVLLTSDLVAKIGDLGNSRFIDPRQMMTMTRNPGNVCYMPPETQEGSTIYDTAMDIFSFGHLALFTLTQTFPTVKAPTYLHSTTHRPMARTEIERRSESLDLVHQTLGSEHPLLQVIEHCLEDYPQSRPSIDIVAQELKDLQLVPYRNWNVGKLTFVSHVVEKERQIQAYYEEAQESSMQAESDRRQMQRLSEENRLLQEQNETLEEQVETLETQVAFVQTQNQTLLSQVMTQQRQIESQQYQNEVQLSQIASHQEEIEALNKKSLTQQSELESLHRRIDTNSKTSEDQREASDHSERVQHLEQQLAKMSVNHHQEHISLSRSYEGQISTHRLRIQALQAQIHARQDQLYAQSLEIKSMQALIDNLQKQQTVFKEVPLLLSDLGQMKGLQDTLQKVALDKNLMKPLSIKWQQCNDLAAGVVGAQTVVCNGKLYLAYGVHILEYASETDEWTELPSPQVQDFSMGVANNKELILVGGITKYEEFSKNVITWHTKSRVWVTRYPPIPHSRTSCSVVGYQHYIIVAGGFHAKSISYVDVLDTLTAQWYKAGKLPIRCHRMNAVLVSDTAFFFGLNIDYHASREFISVSLPALIQQATSISGATGDSNSQVYKTWDKIASMPLCKCTAFNACNFLLAAGGKDRVGESSSAVLWFNLEAEKWEKVGELPAAIRGGACSVLPNGEILLVGGLPNSRSVFKGEIEWENDADTIA